MNRPQPMFRARHRSKLALIVCLATVFSSARASLAGLTLTASSSTISYEILPITQAGGGVPPSVFTLPSSFQGMLQTPGSGFFALQPPNPAFPTESFSTNLVFPFFSASPTFSTAFPSFFGSAFTEDYVATTGPQGTKVTQGGVFYDTRTNLADALQNLPGLASVTFSASTAMFKNTTTADILVTPGSMLSVHGQIGAGGSVAASLSMFVILPGSNALTPFFVNPIILAANSSGQKVAVPNIKADGTGSVSGAASVTLSNGLVTGTGSSTYEGQIDVRPGQSITVEGLLTLVSDPGSSIGISTDLDPGYAAALADSGSSNTADFGVFADVTPAAVPEPSTVVLLAVGMSMAGLWAGWSRSRRVAKV